MKCKLSSLGTTDLETERLMTLKHAVSSVPLFHLSSRQLKSICLRIVLCELSLQCGQESFVGSSCFCGIQSGLVLSLTNGRELKRTIWQFAMEKVMRCFDIQLDWNSCKQYGSHKFVKENVVFKLEVPSLACMNMKTNTNTFISSKNPYIIGTYISTSK